MSAEITGKRKKVAAVLAAVSLYLDQEGTAIDGEREFLQQSVGGSASQWGHSARQEMMAMRRLIQLRAIRF